MKRITYWIFSVGLLIFLSSCAHTSNQNKDDEYFSTWPKGLSPQEIGKRVAERFVVSPHGNFGRSTPPKYINYPESCTWYGALIFSQVTDDKDLESRLIKRFEPILTPAESSMVPPPNHVDHSVFGIVPFEIYILNGDKRCLDLGKFIADKQWEDPLSNGLTRQTRFWIDDMYMITSLQTQAFRATKDEKYLDHAALEMATYLDTLQQPNGLFYHAPDAPFFWGRGDGWVAAGMTELLRNLPKENPHYSRIMDGYQRMMSALLKFQDNNGMWHQLIDKPDAWPETSCSAMFTFAMIAGVKNGWLNEGEYGPAARKAWLGLTNYIDSDAAVHNVCEGTNKNSNMQYYLDRQKNIGDLHGQAPILWCAAALLR